MLCSEDIFAEINSEEDEKLVMVPAYAMLWMISICNDFKEIRNSNFLLDKKGNARYINKSKLEYIMPLWAYKEIQKL